MGSFSPAWVHQLWLFQNCAPLVPLSAWHLVHCLFDRLGVPGSKIICHWLCVWCHFPSEYISGASVFWLTFPGLNSLIIRLTFYIVGNCVPNIWYWRLNHYHTLKKKKKRRRKQNTKNFTPPQKTLFQSSNYSVQKANSIQFWTNSPVLPQAHWKYFSFCCF